MAFDNAYEAVIEDNDASRWAYGTGFSDPLAGIDLTAPSTVDPECCLALGDDALILSHRLQEWCTNAPELEDELALANIGLDLLGQARLLYARTGRDEDELAFGREEREFRNVRLVELPNGDFAHAMARLLVFSAWRLAVMSRLTESADSVLAAIAAKAEKELAYHREYAAGWVIRLGDGTAFSRERMRNGLSAVWPFVDELFTGAETDLRAEFDEFMSGTLAEATLETPDVPPVPGVSGRTGRDGVHTEALGHLLAEMQSVARAHPGATW